MIYLQKITVLCLIILLMSSVVQNNVKPKIKQGIYGQVTWLEGNIMPSPDAPKASKERGVDRNIYIYELSSLGQTTGQAPLFSVVHSKLVKIVTANKHGNYECELPIGKYSVFTKESDGSFFANSFNKNGEISSVELRFKEVTKLDIVINYKASY